MALAIVYPNVAALQIVDLLRTDLVNSKIKLFKNDLLPVPGTVIANLIEADFSGYVAKTVPALLPAYHDPAGGGSAQIGTVQWDHNGGPIANEVFGCWLETAAGDLRLVVRFDSPVPMGVLGDSLPLDLKVGFGN